MSAPYDNYNQDSAPVGAAVGQRYDGQTGNPANYHGQTGGYHPNEQSHEQQRDGYGVMKEHFSGAPPVQENSSESGQNPVYGNATDPNELGDPNAPEGERGLRHAVVGGTTGYIVGHKSHHGFLGAVGGAIVGDFLGDKRHEIRHHIRDEWGGHSSGGNASGHHGSGGQGSGKYGSGEYGPHGYGSGGYGSDGYGPDGYDSGAHHSGGHEHGSGRHAHGSGRY